MKKILIVLMVLLLPTFSWAASSKVADMTEDTAPASDSFIYTVDDPAGTAVDRKVTLANLGLGLLYNKTLIAATGNEIAWTYNYTVNKASSGNDTGLQINFTDTLSPGTSIPFQINRNGGELFKVTVEGAQVGNTIMIGTGFSMRAANLTMLFGGKGFTNADEGYVLNNDTIGNSSGIFYGTVLNPVYNQSGTAGATDLIISRRETALGSGVQNLFDFGVNTDGTRATHTSKFRGLNDGSLIGGKITKSTIWNAGGVSPDGTQCVAPAEVQINSGPIQYSIICADNDASTIYGHTVMPDGWDTGNLTFELEYIQTAADTGPLNSDITIQCRGAGETVNNTWESEIAIDDAAVTGSNGVDHTTSAAVTGTCVAGDTLYWRWQLDATGTTTAVATLNIMGMKMEYISAITD